MKTYVNVFHGRAIHILLCKQAVYGTDAKWNKEKRQHLYCIKKRSKNWSRKDFYDFHVVP